MTLGEWKEWEAGERWYEYREGDWTVLACHSGEFEFMHRAEPYMSSSVWPDVKTLPEEEEVLKKEALAAFYAWRTEMVEQLREKISVLSVSKIDPARLTFRESSARASTVFVRKLLEMVENYDSGKEADTFPQIILAALRCWTTEELAVLVGVSIPTVERWVVGKTKPLGVVRKHVFETLLKNL